MTSTVPRAEPAVSRRPSVVRAGVLVTVGKGASAALQMLTGILIARWLHVSGRGQYQVAVSFNALAGAILCLGIGQASIYLINNRKVPAREVTTTLLWIAAAMLLLYPPILFAIYATHQSYFELHGSSLMICIALSAVLPMPVNLFFPRLMAEMRALDVVAVECLQVFTQLALACTLAALNLLTVQTALLMPLASGMIGLATVLWLVRHSLDLTYRPHSGVVRGLLAYGVKLASLNVAFMANAQAPALLLRTLHPSDFDQLGYYGNAAGLCGLISIVAMASAPLLYARWAGEPDDVRRTRQAEMTSRVFMTLGLGMAVVIAVAAPLIIRTLYTEAFLPAVPCLRLMIFGAAVQLVAHTIQNLFYATGRALISTLLFLVVLACNILMILLLVGGAGQGAIGAALSITFSGFVYLAGSLWLARRFCGLSVRDSVIPRAADFRHFVSAALRRANP